MTTVKNYNLGYEKEQLIFQFSIECLGRGRGGGFGGGRGGSGGGGGGYGTEDKVQSDNQIYVSGLPMNLNEEDIAQYFGSIGVIKNDKRTGKVFR